jgi:hypothetical protein
MEIKIFKIGDYDYVAAENVDDAFKCYADMMGGSEEADEIRQIGDFHEIGDFAMDKITIREEECEDEDGCEMDQDERTFRVELQRLVNVGSKFPVIFCSSEG